MNQSKKTLPDHFSQGYFTKFRHTSLVKTFLLQIIDRKEPTFSRLKHHFPPQSTLLDYGCGNGLFLKYAATYFQTIGIDFSLEAIKFAKKASPKSKLIKGDEKSLSKLKSDSIDIITCFDVLEHIPQHQRLLQQFHRILKPTGWLVISVPNTDSIAFSWKKERWWAMEDKSHFWLWPASRWKLLLSQYGFITHSTVSIGLLNSPVKGYSVTGLHYLFHLFTQALAVLGLPLPSTLSDVVHLIASKNPHTPTKKIL